MGLLGWVEDHLQKSAMMAEAIARRIAGPNTDADSLGHARRIAEAQVDLDRVRAYRRRIYIREIEKLDYQPLRVRSCRLCSWQSKIDFAGLMLDHLCSGRLRKQRLPNPTETSKSWRRFWRTELARLRHLTGTSDALCRDAKPRSAILTRLERSPLCSAHTKLNMIDEKSSSWRLNQIKDITAQRNKRSNSSSININSRSEWIEWNACKA
jgi:hypothetical protein